MLVDLRTNADPSGLIAAELASYYIMYLVIDQFEHRCQNFIPPDETAINSAEQYAGGLEDAALNVTLVPRKLLPISKQQRRHMSNYDLRKLLAEMSKPAALRARYLRAESNLLKAEHKWATETLLRLRRMREENQPDLIDFLTVAFTYPPHLAWIRFFYESARKACALPQSPQSTPPPVGMLRIEEGSRGRRTCDYNPPPQAKCG